MTSANEIRCDKLVELITDYLDGALNAETERRIDASLAACEGCARYLAQIRETISALGNLPTEALPHNSKDALLTAFRRATR